MSTAIWAEHFLDRGIEETFETVAAIGYDAVAITPWLHDGTDPTMSGSTIDQIAAALDEHGLEVSGTARAFGPNHDHLVTSPDADVRERTREYLSDLATLCSSLGGRVITFGAGPQRSYPDDISFGAAWENAQEVFGHESLLERLEAHDVAIGIEPLSPSSTNFLNTTPETVRFVEEIDHPNVGVTIDGYHLVNEPGTFTELVDECRGHLVEFHADDPSGFGPGSGDQDYGEIYDALAGIDFDGYVTVEFHAFLGGEVPDEDPRTLADRSLTYLGAQRP